MFWLDGAIKKPDLESFTPLTGVFRDHCFGDYLICGITMDWAATQAFFEHDSSLIGLWIDGERRLEWHFVAFKRLFFMFIAAISESKAFTLGSPDGF